METHVPSLPVIDAGNFNQTGGSNPIIIVQAWVSWDLASRRLDTWLRQARDSYTNLRFYAMDIDQEQNWPFAAKWAIATTPTLICIFNGVFHEMQVGMRPEPQMRAKLSEWNSLGRE